MNGFDSFSPADEHLDGFADALLVCIATVYATAAILSGACSCVTALAALF